MGAKSQRSSWHGMIGESEERNRENVLERERGSAGMGDGEEIILFSQIL